MVPRLRLRLKGYRKVDAGLSPLGFEHLGPHHQRAVRDHGGPDSTVTLATLCPFGIAGISWEVWAR